MGAEIWCILGGGASLELSLELSRGLGLRLGLSPELRLGHGLSPELRHGLSIGGSFEVSFELGWASR